MRILFFTHYFSPEGNAPASRAHQLCKRWAKAGQDVHVITCAPNVPNGVVYDGYKNRTVHNEMLDGIKTKRVWTFIAANKGSVKRILNYLSFMFTATFAGLFVEKPGVVIATSPQFFCGWAGIITSRIRRIPFILEIRDIWPDSIAAVGAIRNKRILRFLRFLEQKMYAAADHIVTVGEGYHRRLLDKGVAAGKISIVPNGVDRQLFSPREPDISLKEHLGLNGKFLCSYLGTIGMACGLSIVLRAGEILKNKKRDDIVFLLVGDGAVREELQAQAHRRKLHNIIFTGRQDKNRIPSFLSITNASLVHLRKTDLFTTVVPSKIFEAAGMACPVIIGVEGFATKLAQQARNGICIEPENENQLVDAVEKLADNPALCRSLGRSGYEHITRHYDRDHLAKAYLDIIKKISADGANI